MKVTVLGPWGAFPKAGEATAGYLLETGGGKRYLIDCGSGVLSALQRIIPLHALDGAFVSHRHYDHTADLGCLQYGCLIESDLALRQGNLPIYFAGESEAEIAYKSMKGSVIYPVGAGRKLKLDDLTVTFFKTYHGVYCLGMAFEAGGRKLVYTADTTFDERLIPHCADADVLIAETSFYADMEASEYGHMNAAEVATLAKEAGARKLVLTHLPHFGELPKLAEEAAAGFEGEIVLATCGLDISLG
ncbi:ribonuclease BN (tRNA processing enzyme) [Paenibacillus methanolicus]|uniref:Ribonuclease BN (tRNA processing enzyme) n=2 Tax=Paenibacillus methanolicus TaxID=582686 RepID=A0A5S5C0B7_9BACL|nr:ribonuclease BN (tRNA processing enzyme) [Paenibacillus methanolicus]